MDDSRALQQSLDAAVDPGGDPYVNKIIRIMATRCVCEGRKRQNKPSPDPNETKRNEMGR